MATKKDAELSKEDQAILKAGQDNAAVKSAGERIDKILKETDCYLAPDGNSPLNNIRIVVVKQPPKPKQ
ncbi:MAG: hypothetical protein KUG81_05330 [Gammaproteobacteria bacterium]|nr:hypothetical protein [Gammaproteobacteria bacterium]